MFRWPGSRVDFWRTKIEGNKARDAAAQAGLVAVGWRVLTVWECALKGKGRLPIDRVLDLASNWLVSGDGPYTIQGSTQYGAD